MARGKPTTEEQRAPEINRAPEAVLNATASAGRVIQGDPFPHERETFVASLK